MGHLRGGAAAEHGLHERAVRAELRLGFLQPVGERHLFQVLVDRRRGVEVVLQRGQVRVPELLQAHVVGLLLLRHVADDVARLAQQLRAPEPDQALLGQVLVVLLLRRGDGVPRVRARGQLAVAGEARAQVLLRLRLGGHGLGVLQRLQHALPRLDAVLVAEDRLLRAPLVLG